MNERDRGYSSPLLAASRSKGSDDVRLLLNFWVDANGVSLGDISLHAAGFLRFGPLISNGSAPDPYLTAIHTRDETLIAISQRQISPLTQWEIDDRSEDCSGRFWTEPHLRPLAQIPYGETVPVIMEAPQTGCTKKVKLFVDAGADVSFWLSN